jgi:hypothetical protein
MGPVATTQPPLAQSADAPGRTGYQICPGIYQFWLRPLRVCLREANLLQPSCVAH